MWERSEWHRLGLGSAVLVVLVSSSPGNAAAEGDARELAEARHSPRLGSLPSAESERAPGLDFRPAVQLEPAEPLIGPEDLL